VTSDLDAEDQRIAGARRLQPPASRLRYSGTEPPVMSIRRPACRVKQDGRRSAGRQAARCASIRCCGPGGGWLDSATTVGQSGRHLKSAAPHYVAAGADHDLTRPRQMVATKSSVLLNTLALEQPCASMP